MPPRRPRSKTRRPAPQFGEVGASYPLPENFDARLREKVEAMLTRAPGRDRVTDREWTRLGQILGEFQFWSSMIDDGGFRLLTSVAKKAAALSEALSRVDGTVLDPTVARTLGRGKSGAHSKAVLVKRLNQLAAVSDFAPYSGGSKLAARLYAQLAEWWRNTGGKKSVRHDDFTSPFSEFVALAISALPREVRPSASAKTLERRLKEAEANAEAEKRALNRVAAKLRALGTN